MENIHPITVHFTIALFTMAVIFEGLGWLFKKESLKNAGWWNLLFAALAAIVSILTGLKAASTAPHDDAFHRIMEIHETLGFVALAVIIGLFVWRSIAKGKFAAKLLYAYLVLAAGGLAVMFAGGYFGGELVFTHGMGVKPMMEMMAESRHDHSDHHSEVGGNKHDLSDSHMQDDSHNHDLQPGASANRKVNLKKNEEHSFYQCPMHKEITSSQPGQCSKCGMTLDKTDAPEMDTYSETKISDSNDESHDHAHTPHKH